MLSGHNSFEPIFDVGCLPVIPLSQTENKLMRKTVDLASMLAGKTSFTGDATYQGRRHLLMAAAIRIAHSLGETAEIFRDDRVIEIIDILANFSFEYLQKLDWYDIELFSEKVKHAKRLITLFAWRKRTRGDPPVSIVKLLRHIEPFVHAIEKREAFNSALARFECCQTKALLRKWRDAVAHKKMAKFQKALVYSRWKQLCKQTVAASRIYKNYLVTTFFQTWRAHRRDVCKDGQLASRLLFTQGIDPTKVNARSYDMLQTASEMSLKARIFADWRRETRGKCLADLHAKDLQRKTLKNWARLATNSQWLMKTAEFHDKVRRLRPIMAHMRESSGRFREAVQYLTEHARLKKCYEVLGKWKKAVKTRSLKRRYFDTFVRKSRFLISAGQHATKLAEVTSELRSLNLWKSKFARQKSYSDHLSERAAIFTRRKQKVCFSGWRAKAAHHRSHSSVVEAWRAKEDKTEFFGVWKAKAIVEHNCKAFYLRSVYRSVLDTWKEAQQRRKERKRLVTRFFGAWRRHTKETQALRCFTGSLMTKNNTNPAKIVPSNILNRMHFVCSADQSNQLTTMARCFKLWHKSSSKVKLLDQQLDKLVLSQKKKMFGLMRLVFRCHELAEDEPRKDLERAWRQFKLGCSRLCQRNLVLNVRLDEHFGSQEFMLHFRYFKIWERAFQVRKMEEHLCEQNLMAHEHQQKRNVIKMWKLVTGQRMFQQYSNLVNRRKSILGQWRAATKNTVAERNRRIVKRTLDTWRNSLMASRVGPLAKQLEMRKKARAFERWKRFGGSKYEVRFSRTGQVTTPWFVQTPPPPPRFHDTAVRKVNFKA